MKITNNVLILASLLSLACPMAQAASATFSETQTDKLKCRKVEGVTECEVETSGKFQAMVVLPATTLVARNFSVFGISANTEVGVSIGAFQFSDVIGHSKFTMSSAVWKLTHEVCNSQEKCKNVVDTTVTGKIGLTKLAVKLSGTSKSEVFGNSIFASLCAGRTEGETPFSDVPVTLNLADPGDETKKPPTPAFDQSFTATASGTCNVKTVSKKAKTGEMFGLTTIKVKGTISDLQ